MPPDDESRPAKAALINVAGEHSSTAVPRPRSRPRPRTDPRRYDAAVSLALDGFAIVPMLEGHKEPIGLEWQRLATSDPDAIGEMLRPPGRQFGVYPPPGSGLVVIDFDRLDIYERMAQLIPATLIVKTAKGYHVYGRLPEGVDEADVPRTFEGGEVRIAGSGQVVGPFGKHPSGHIYEPLNGTLEPHELPRALIDALWASHEAKTGAQRAARGPEDPDWTVTEPGRHDFLLARARNLRGVGLSGERLAAEVHRLNRERCRPPKDEPEVRAIVDWIEGHISDDPPPGFVIRGIDPAPASEGIDAVDLLALDLPPLRMIVPDLIPEGTTVIASPPKVGKSCLVYQVAVEVALGGELFGKRVAPGSVLYLALEDGRRRGRERLGAALEGRTLPRGRLTVQWGARKIGEGLEEDIGTWLDGHADAALVAIDTLGKVRPRTSGKRNAYEIDVEDLGRLQNLFRDRPIALVIVHHSRKDASGDDFLASVSGTYGITGSVDTIVVIRRKRLETFGVILATGRDIPEAEVPVRFNGMTWEDAPGSLPEASFERAEVYRIIEDHGPIFPAAIAERTGLERTSVQHMVGKLVDSGAVARRTGGYEAVGPSRARVSPLPDHSDNSESDWRDRGHVGPAQPVDPVLQQVLDMTGSELLPEAPSMTDGSRT